MHHLLQDTKEEEIVHFFGQFDGAKSAQMRLFRDGKEDPWKFSGSVFLTFDDCCLARKVTHTRNPFFSPSGFTPYVGPTEVVLDLTLDAALLFVVRP